MSIDILMPALSPTMEEGTLAKWHVKVGDVVKSGDVIAEIETDKATMEVEAVDEGVVEAILVDAGTENVKVNSLIAKLARGDGDSPAPPPAKAAPPPLKRPRPPPAPAPAAALRPLRWRGFPPHKPATACLLRLWLDRLAQAEPGPEDRQGQRSARPRGQG
jgi:pyruvate dehydrogenase E2 component (dihydrolipoamide acetyltransferase)